ncbi:MAG: hypothetical protein KAJ14_03270 [Candidatus Omnitrophica bacterium]|nr:hypothetical protein [Candidatus Omnitrophota bacterium]
MLDEKMEKNMEIKKTMELYKITVEEEHFFLKEHQSRVSFYMSLITALVGAMITGLFYVHSFGQYFLLILAPIALIFVLKNAKEGATRMYQRFLEAITVRAKLENILGMDKKRPDSQEWFKSEAIITERHRASRAESHHKNSQDWVNEHLDIDKKVNYHTTVTKLFNTCEILAKFMLIVVILLCVVSLFKKTPNNSIQRTEPAARGSVR